MDVSTIKENYSFMETHFVPHTQPSVDLHAYPNINPYGSSSHHDIKKLLPHGGETTQSKQLGLHCLAAAPIMISKNYFPMEEKPPKANNWGSIASQYQVCTAHSFFPPGSPNEVLMHLAQHLFSNSTARLVVNIFCHPAILSGSTVLPSP
jgi:hypothetical protein